MDGWPNLTKTWFYEKKSKELRLKCLNMVKKAGKGHLGGTFSIIDLLVVLYYGQKINVMPNLYNPLDKDSVIIGKGHANLAFLNIWNDMGLLRDEILETYGKNAGLGGQLDTHTLSIVDNITGSLGHAIGIASGIALANRLDNCSNRAIAIVGDGEMEEGSIWESLDFAAKQKLDNLLCIVDRNGLSVTSTIENDNLEEKVKAFGWNVKVVDGHDLGLIEHEYDEFFKSHYQRSELPTMIIADTVKGKGVSFMENNTSWHHGCPTDEEYEIALKELE